MKTAMANNPTNTAKFFHDRTTGSFGPETMRYGTSIIFFMTESVA